MQRIELQHQPELVGEVPGLLPLAVGKAHDSDLGHLDALATRWQAVELAALRAGDLEPHPHRLALGNEPSMRSRRSGNAAVMVSVPTPLALPWSRRCWK